MYLSYDVLGHMFNGSKLLITGATGSLGSKLVTAICTQFQPERLVLISRNEYHHYRLTLETSEHSFVEPLIADIRDRIRMFEVTRDIDYIIHTAALKHVLICEDNPRESVATNIVGSQNIIDAAIANNVKKVIFISTDKANSPSCIYGATKFVADKLCLQANVHKKTVFSVVRFGNIFGSKGSVIERFCEIPPNSTFPITHQDITRAFITIPEIIRLIFKAFEMMTGGEVFVPRMKSIKIVNIPFVINPEAKIEIIGMKNGERMHEILITQDNVDMTYLSDDFYVILPKYWWWKPSEAQQQLSKIEDLSEIDSSCCEFFSLEELRKLIHQYQHGEI